MTYYYPHNPVCGSSNPFTALRRFFGGHSSREQRAPRQQASYDVYPSSTSPAHVPSNSRKRYRQEYEHAAPSHTSYTFSPSYHDDAIPPPVPPKDRRYRRRQAAHNTARHAAATHNPYEPSPLYQSHNSNYGQDYYNSSNNRNAWYAPTLPPSYPYHTPPSGHSATLPSSRSRSGSRNTQVYYNDDSRGQYRSPSSSRREYRNGPMLGRRYPVDPWTR